MDTKNKPKLHTSLSGNTLNVFSTDKAVNLSFDLEKVKMSKEQKDIVHKLLNQNPIGEASLEVDPSDQQIGPGSKYLTAEEFESIRKLGVRLGTGGDVSVSAATACDFCLHCVALQVNESWVGGIEKS
jgi:hypothetical protein